MDEGGLQGYQDQYSHRPQGVNRTAGKVLAIAEPKVLPFVLPLQGLDDVRIAASLINDGIHGDHRGSQDNNQQAHLDALPYIVPQANAIAVWFNVECN